MKLALSVRGHRDAGARGSANRTAWPSLMAVYFVGAGSACLVAFRPGWLPTMLGFIAGTGSGTLVTFRVARRNEPSAIEASTRLIAGYEVEVLEVPGEGLPILLAHGFSRSARSWVEVMELLALHGRRVVAVELPGVSADAPPIREGPIIPELAAFLREAIEQLCPGELVLPVGHSLGSGAALELARDPDAPIVGVLAIGPPGIKRPRWMRMASRPGVIGLADRLTALPVAARGAVAATVYRIVNPRERRETITEVRLRVGDSRLARWFVEFGGALLLELREPIDLHGIRHPIHFVWGSKDSISPASGARRVRAERPDFDVTILPGVNHNVPRERPEKLVELLLAWPPAAHHQPNRGARQGAAAGPRRVPRGHTGRMRHVRRHRWRRGRAVRERRSTRRLGREGAESVSAEHEPAVRPRR
jgi:pimeloyl-ACP methyl ester carboxylesterase